MPKIEELIKKYNSGLCTEEEKRWLEQWYYSFEWNDKSKTISDEDIIQLKEDVWQTIQNTVGVKVTLNESPKISKQFSKYPWWRIAVAAAIISTVITVAFFLYKPKNEIIAVNYFTPKNTTINELKPGTSKAQLLLANGSIILLDSAQHMQLKEEDGTSIDKQSGKLVYNDSKAEGEKILFNTLATPRGGEYQLVLPDGSKVWLNAASSIKFPTRFFGKERMVFLKGEAYFEVAKNKAMPFRVKMDNEMTVEVVGTHFNIMGYLDESEIRTTLVEGAVKVTSKSSQVFLSPSRQAVLKRRNEKLSVNDADVSKALAWKNGIIEFDGDDLPYIMRQLSRWYDVDISLKNNTPTETYRGAIRRQAPLADVLEILKIAGVKFKIEDRQIIVTGG